MHFIKNKFVAVVIEVKIQNRIVFPCNFALSHCRDLTVPVCHRNTGSLLGRWDKCVRVERLMLINSSNVSLFSIYCYVDYTNVSVYLLNDPLIKE